MVSCWAESVTIPTYQIGEPNKNPMFLEKRIYQGSSGVVYPHPVIDRVFDEQIDRTYTAVFLENRYLKIMILPEIGGRVQMALDKTNGYHFVYYNRVIKPALVGLTGPWISGGIEFNWPQHHRPSTFDPLDWRIEEHDDGRKTVWCGEIERMFRTKGVHGFTLYPDRAYLEVNVQLYNRTPFPQTFLWWANPAVHVNDHTQSIFPPDVHAVMDHGKRDVSDFPIATGTYYKKDYAPGTDISRYKNIPVPTSYMVYHSDYDFVGCYDHKRGAGMMHVANHHVVPGKKQWTWGNSDFGQAWDRQLTDEDGPYIELMCGAYTDNQPDFSWIQPGEEKRFTQVFMPYKEIGAAKNASRDAVVNLEVEAEQVHLAVYLSRPLSVEVALLHNEHLLFHKEAALSPENTLIETVLLENPANPASLTLKVTQVGGQELIAFTPPGPEKGELPAPATPARSPAEIPTNEGLFLNGLHLEQYRHVTYQPEPYYEEALRRDPGDSRCNNAMGRLALRRGRFADAERYFRRGLTRLTDRNPNPYDGELFYNLGLACKMQGRFQPAKDAFYKSTWSAAWQRSAYFELAKLACQAHQLEEALDLLERALDSGRRHHNARHLKIALLRQLGRGGAALEEAHTALSLDPLAVGALWEIKLLTGALPDGFNLRLDRETIIELALDYGDAAFFADGIELLQRIPADPMAGYLQGWLLHRAGDKSDALRMMGEAASRSADRCFPHRIEEMQALNLAGQLRPEDPRASYYLGDFLYAHRRYDEAISAWETARTLDERFPTVHRNLGLAYFNKRGDADRALDALETAFALNPDDARVLFELDQLYKKLNRSPAERLERLERYEDLTDRRDDLMIERVTLLNLLGRPHDALALLRSRNFHPWEGGEGKVSGQYVATLVELGRRHLAAGRFAEALSLFEEARVYPSNLGEGKLYGAQENNIFFYRGCAHEGLGQAAAAHDDFARAAVGLSEPSSAVFYNDQPPDMIFYQGLALQKLGRHEEAAVIFEKLVGYGQAHIDDPVTMDYFAVSLPDFLVFDEDLTEKNKVHCHYMMALGWTGLGDKEKAAIHFDQVLKRHSSHLGAAVHRSL